MATRPRKGEQRHRLGSAMAQTCMNCKTSPAPEPSATSLTLHCAPLLSYRLLSLSYALVPGHVTWSPKISVAIVAPNVVACRWGNGCAPHFFTFLQTLSVDRTPASPGDGSLFVPPVFPNPHCLQVSSNQVSPSSSWSTRGAWLREPTKQHLLRDAVTLHPGYVL